MHRLPLPLPGDALKAVNVYAVDDGDGLTLIDGGWAVGAAREALEASLARLGHDLGSVRQFLVTHVHRDHYTLAVVVRNELGARVALGIGERASLEHMRHPEQVNHELILRQLAALGAGDLVERVRGNRPPPSDPDELWGLPDQWLDGRLRFEVGDRVLEAIPTPGHTAGHYVFLDPAARLLFAGDHVLPHITPSIGFEAVPALAPLDAFLASLAVVQELPDARLLPAHGPVADSAHARVVELFDHHDRRLADTLQVVAAGDGDSAYTVATRLGWTRRRTPFAALDPFNQMLAVNETHAHLVTLTNRGQLTWTLDRDGVRHYVVAAAH